MAESVKRRIVKAGRWLARASGTHEWVKRDWQELRAYARTMGKDPDTLVFGHCNFFHFVDAGIVSVAGAPSEGCGITLWCHGGAIDRVPVDAMAFTGRDAEWWLGVEAEWDDAADDEVHVAWGRTTMGALQPFTTAGHYVNDMIETGDDIVRAARTSHGTFYLYFTNKEDLLRALAVDCAHDLTALADTIGPITPDDAGREELRRRRVLPAVGAAHERA